LLVAFYFNIVHFACEWHFGHMFIFHGTKNFDPLFNLPYTTIYIWPSSLLWKYVSNPNYILPELPKAYCMIGTLWLNFKEFWKLKFDNFGISLGMNFLSNAKHVVKKRPLGKEEFFLANLLDLCHWGQWLVLGERERKKCQCNQNYIWPKLQLHVNYLHAIGNFGTLGHNGKPSNVTMFSTDLFLPKPSFLGIYLNFQKQKSFKNQYLSHSESKSYQIKFH
jgi:hypothetical protein